MAISYGIVANAGDMGRVYDVTLAAADAAGTIDFTATVDGASVGFRYVPTVAIMTPMDITLTAAQVLAANGGSGAAGTYAGGVGFFTDTVKITSLTANSCVFASGATVLKSFRIWVGRAYQPHAT